MQFGPFRLDECNEEHASQAEVVAAPIRRSPMGQLLRQARLRLHDDPGDFGVSRESWAEPEELSNQSNDSSFRIAAAPERQYSCSNYDTCLGLAAALDWRSFTCSGCAGAVNRQLLWRAHQRVRKNPELSRLCKLPILTEPEAVPYPAPSYAPNLRER